MSDIERTVADKSRDVTETASTVRYYLRLLDQNAERYLLYALYTYIIFIVAAEVFRRFALNNSSLWGAETARYMFIYLTWIGAAWGIRTRQHIRVDIIYEVVSERTVGLLHVLSDVAMLVFAYITLAWFMPTMQTTLEFGASIQSLRVSQGYFMAAIPIGFGLVAIRSLQMLYLDVRAVLNDEPVYRGSSLFGGEGDGESEPPSGSDAEVGGD